VTEPEKNPSEQLIDWFSGWKASFDQLRERIGWAGALALLLTLVAALIWWKWEKLVQLPGVRPLIQLLTRRRIRLAPAGRLTVAVAHLDSSRV
jgi:hypothetical protein